MIPVNALLASMATRLANDAAILADPAFVKIALVKAAFNPIPTLVIGDLTFADFTGSAPKATTVAVAQTFLDPQTGEQIIQINEPVGGWHWQTTNLVNLPQTIFGYALTDPAGAVLWATALLPAPIALNAVAQGVDIPQARFRLSASALS